MALSPVCMGSDTDPREMIPGALMSTRRRLSVLIGPFPSMGLPRPSTTLPKSSSPTGTSTMAPVLLTVSPSLMFLSLPNTTIPTLSFSKFRAIPFNPDSNSTISSAWMFLKPWTQAIPSFRIEHGVHACASWCDEHWERKQEGLQKGSFGSKDKLKPGWSDAFGELLNDVVATKDDIACVFQVVVGGGAQTRLGKADLNALSQRDVQLNSIVFDLFHGADDKDFKAADEFQHRFELEVVNEYQTAYPHVMAQWASHGDLDMDKQEVWETYFDKPETYHRLRQIKRDWDPDDVFHSRFTVRPATD